MLRRAITLAALAGMLGAPSAAHADAFDDVFSDYRSDGNITACDHTVADLRAARDGIPSDIEQYAPDFPAALDDAVTDRGRRDCGGAAGATGAVGGGGQDPAAPAGPAAETPGAAVIEGDGGPVATVPQPPGTARVAPSAADGAIVNAASRTADRGAGETPAPLIALAVIGVLILLGLLAWSLARFLAWDPAWLAGARHAVQEAGWRVSAVWDDFSDWLRPGRRGPA